MGNASSAGGRPPLAPLPAARQTPRISGQCAKKRLRFRPAAKCRADR